MKTHFSDMQIIQRRLISQGSLSPPTVRMKHFYQRTPNAPIPEIFLTGLLLSRARFRFFPVKQMYAYLVYANKNKILYNSMWTSIWSE
jgi:hypothetical protein